MRKTIFIFFLPTFLFAQWAIGFGGTSDDAGTSIAVDGSGNTYITGHFEGIVDFDPGSGVFNLTSKGQADIFIATYSSNGDFIWTKSLGGTEDDIGFSIVLDDLGNLYVTGNFQSNANIDLGNGTTNLSSSGDYDIFLVKYLSDGTVKVEEDFGLPCEFQLSQNYPNPFNPTTTISYSLPFFVVKENFPSLQNVQLIIYDVLGKEVATLVNEQQAAGNYRIEFDASSLSSGIFFYTIRSG